MCCAKWSSVFKLGFILETSFNYSVKQNDSKLIVKKQFVSS